jgi:hypothetical protein
MEQICAIQMKWLLVACLFLFDLKKSSINIDFKWILLFFFCVRLLGITNPPLERGHNWRQSTGLMVVRNFLEVDANILKPRIDDHEGWEGVVAMELPLLNYTHFLVAKVLGYTHWYSRLINLLVTSLGIWCFYLLLRDTVDKRFAWFAGLALLVGTWFMFSRKSMPDTFSFSLALMAVYAAHKYFSQRKLIYLLAYAVLACLALLTKPPALLVGSLTLLPLIAQRSSFKDYLTLLAASIPALALLVWWFFYHNPAIYAEYGIWYNQGDSFLTGLSSIKNNSVLVLKRLAFGATFSWLGLVLVVLGFILVFKQQSKLRLPILVYALLMALFTVKAGRLFIENSHYVVVLAPLYALLIAYTLSSIKKSWLWVLVVVWSIESVANQIHDFKVPAQEEYKLTLEGFLDEHIAGDKTVAISSVDGNHQLMYLAHRKGWMLRLENITNTKELAYIKERGGDYVVVDKKITTLKPPLPLHSANEYFEIYKL